MMQTKRLLGIALAAATIAGFATTTAEAQTVLGIGGGVSLPMGDSGDDLDTGFAVHGSATFAMPRLPIGIRADVEFNQWSFAAPADGNFRTISGIVSGVLDIPMDALGFYVLAGVGVYNVGNGDSSTEFGVSAGAGARFTIGTLAPFVEARFHNVFTDGDSDLQFLPIQLGLSFPLF